MKKGGINAHFSRILPIKTNGYSKNWYLISKPEFLLSVQSSHYKFVDMVIAVE